MRTNIEIDDELMREAQEAAGTRTKKETVEAALRYLVRMKAQEGLRQSRGKVHWEGDLEGMRKGRFVGRDDR